METGNKANFCHSTHLPNGGIRVTVFWILSELLHRMGSLSAAALHWVRIGADSTQRMPIHCGFQILEANPHHSGFGCTPVEQHWKQIIFELGQNDMLHLHLLQFTKSLVAQPENQIDMTVVLANRRKDSHKAEKKSNISGRFQPASFCLSCIANCFLLRPCPWHHDHVYDICFAYR